MPAPRKYPDKLRERAIRIGRRRSGPRPMNSGQELRHVPHRLGQVGPVGEERDREPHTNIVPGGRAEVDAVMTQPDHTHVAHYGATGDFARPGQTPHLAETHDAVAADSWRKGARQYVLDSYGSSALIEVSDDRWDLERRGTTRRRAPDLRGVHAGVDMVAGQRCDAAVGRLPRRSQAPRSRCSRRKCSTFQRDSLRRSRIVAAANGSLAPTMVGSVMA